MTSAFSYRAGVLHIEKVSVEKIAAEIGTPFYAYSTEQLKTNYKAFAESFEGQKAKIYYAVKANCNVAVIRTLAECGAGADITSIGELERALAAGIAPQKIIFSGVGKQRDEIMAALLADIHQLNVESIPELHLVEKVAAEIGCKAPIALRVNPDVVAQTNKKLATAEEGTKFGIDLVQLDEAMGIATSLPHLDFKGFHVHVGSHSLDPNSTQVESYSVNFEPFRNAFTKLAELTQHWRKKGVNVQRLDLGSGVGIPYDGERIPPFSDYADIVNETVGNLGCDIAFEPGKRIVGDAGILVSRVIYDKQGGNKRFLILDAGMNDLIRPAMYGARHSIISVHENKDKDASPVDVVGPVCETSDLFGEDYILPGVGDGDLIAIQQAGAYGSAMSSNYNGRTLIPEVLVSGDSYAVVRRRISIAEQMTWEALPAWMNDKNKA